ncbi:FkbM family methyltransferase [Hymenobacter perfusus]|uniref:FkbM family methyltransferase n=2 Tax=Hymenobacter perfusus TaxID=1236770 RepID=A0A3R9MFE2_9BACT|nr:FkbM family methyltransferase [Hymenobacter perfusus]
MTNLKRTIHQNTLARFQYMKSFQKLGVTFDEYCDFLYFNTETGFALQNATLFGKSIKRNNAFWFVQNVEEVFIQEVYRFQPKTSTPYILDCGSNIGLSLIYFKRQFPQARVVGFEPDPIIHETCRYNLKAFGYDDVEVLNAAVWKQAGSIHFLPDNCLGGKIVEGELPAGVDAAQVTSLKAVRLKSYLTEKIDFMKIDIEGAEMDVLRDCQDELHWVENLFIEYHSAGNKPQELPELLSMLSAAGFRYYINSAWQKMKHPFVEHPIHTTSSYDLQLNIFAYRR